VACTLSRGVSNLKNCAVRNKLVQKFSDDEMGVNSELLNNFCQAISTSNMYGIMYLLHDHGRFFNGLSKEKTVSVLHKLVHGPKGMKSRNTLKFNRGISLDIYPGHEVLEIRCYNQQADEDSDGDAERFMGPDFGEPILSSKDEIIYRFVFRFYEQKIFDIKMIHNAVVNPQRIVFNN
jgi:hypothetical protein